MDQPPAVAFTAFADTWPRAIETETVAALCAIGREKGLSEKCRRKIDRSRMKEAELLLVEHVLAHKSKSF